jgi:hypothetical protein
MIMKLHPQNSTPGISEPKKPVEIREVVDILDLILDGLGHTQTSYYYGAARDRLKELKRRL